MAMSRMAMLLVLAGSSASAQPRQVTAEEAMEIHRRTFSVDPEVECGRPLGVALMVGKAVAEKAVEALVEVE